MERIIKILSYSNDGGSDGDDSDDDGDGEDDNNEGIRDQKCSNHYI